MIYPQELLEKPSTSELLRNRIEMQRKYIEILKQKFAGQIVCALPMYPREPKGLDMISQVADDLMRPKITL